MSDSNDLGLIRERIVGVVSGVPGIGRVHGFQRFAANEKAFREHYLVDGQIRGWFVRRLNARTTSAALYSRKTVREWRIQGYLALNDAEQSELQLDALIEAMAAAFEADETLGGAVDTVLGSDSGDPAGLQVVDTGPVMFCGVLCHAAVLSLFTISRR